jgi:hypothetical protein
LSQEENTHEALEDLSLLLIAVLILSACTAGTVPAAQPAALRRKN